MYALQGIYQSYTYNSCLLYSLPFAVVEVHTTHAAKVLTTTQVFATSTPHTQAYLHTHTDTNLLLAFAIKQAANFHVIEKRAENRKNP